MRCYDSLTAHHWNPSLIHPSHCGYIELSYDPSHRSHISHVRTVTCAVPGNGCIVIQADLSYLCVAACGLPRISDMILKIRVVEIIRIVRMRE